MQTNRIDTDPANIADKSIQKNSYFTFFKRVLSNEKLDLKDKTLQYNTFPICVEWNTKLIKIHYMFLTMGVSIVFVRSAEGKIIGRIKKTELISLRFKSPA